MPLTILESDPIHQADADPQLYECNICLDTARYPVLTLCGHLFCWKCLVVWLKTCNLEKQDTTCPVCLLKCDEKKDIIPIYGRVEDKEETDIPKRPMGHRPDVVTYAMHSTAGDGEYDTVEGFRIFNRRIVVHATSRILPSLTIDQHAIIVETGQTGILSRLILMLICLYIVAILFY